MATAPTQSSSVVTVACKLPHGLILRLAKAEKSREPVMGGGFREIDQFRAIGEPVEVFGVAHPQNAAPKAMIVGGYALTTVDKAFWDAWLTQNKEHAAVKNQMIFAYEKEGDTRAASRDNEKRRSGLERLDPNKLPRGLQTVKSTAEA